MDLDTQIHKIYEWWKTAMMVVANRKSVWPRAADHRKTYMYMWFKKFAEWSIKNNLDDELMQRTVVSLVKYAKKNDILRKGASILQHEKIYEIALKEFDNHEDKLENDLEKLRNSCENVDANKANYSAVDYLLKSKGIGQLPNIVVLFNSNSISKDYLALSLTCRKVLNKLQHDYRFMLPDDKELLKIKELTQINKSRSIAVYKILGSDYVNSKKHLINN